MQNHYLLDGVGNHHQVVSLVQLLSNLIHVVDGLYLWAIFDTRDLRLNSTKKQLGIELGITSLLTTSDGEKVANPRNLQKLHKKLKLAQKSLSWNWDKKSNNYQKARLKVAKIHALIKDLRLDYTHKLTTQLIRENQTIVVEDLAIKN